MKNHNLAHKKLLGFAAPYMLGLVVGVGIVSTTMANQAKLKLANYEKTYVQQKLENVQKIAKSLQNVYTVNADGTVTQAKLKEHFYTNAFNFDDIITATQVGSTGETKTVISVDGNKYTLNNLSTATASNLLQKDLSNSATVVLDENSIRQQQISKSYENMKLQAKDVYNSLIADKSYIFPCTISNRYKDAWGRNFNFARDAINKATISFTLPWDTSKYRKIDVRLPNMPIETTEEIVDIVGNTYSTFILTSEGNVYGAGNISGLANGFVKADLPPISKMVNHLDSTYFIASNGELWVYGLNSNGQLGLGDNVNYFYEYKKTNLTNIVNIFPNLYYAYALKSNGRVYSTGKDHNTFHYNLGHGNTNNLNVWTLVNGVTNVRDMLVRRVGVIALTNSDELWAVGGNYYGTLGTPSNPLQNWYRTATNVKNIAKGKASLGYDYGTVIIKNDNSVWVSGLIAKNYGSSWTSFTEFASLGVKSIDYGGGFYVIDGNNDLWVNGTNSVGRLGLGDTNNRTTWTKTSLTNVKKIITGNNKGNAFAVLYDGSVYAAGKNTNYELGLGHNTNALSWTLVPLTNVVDVFSRPKQTFFLRDNGEMYFAGYNSYGNAGTGDAINQDITVVKSASISNISLYPTIIDENTEGRFLNRSVFSDGKTVWVSGSNAYNGVKLSSGNTLTFTNVLDVYDMISSCN